MTASDWVSRLGLTAHPEGGWFRETYRSRGEAEFPGFGLPRNYLTSIYFLLEAGQFSALHRIKSDELWYFHAGGALEIAEIDAEGSLRLTRLGGGPDEVLTHCVQAGTWFGSRPLEGSAYSLVSCAVAPGFDFHDFEMPGRSFFLEHFPGLSEHIPAFTRV